MKIIRISFILLLLAILSCEYNETNQPGGIKAGIDLDEIRASGKLSVLTDYSPTDYYILDGRPMGYQYELLQNLAEYLGVRLEVSISHDIEESIRMLQDGKADLIAQSLIITSRRKAEVDFTIPFMSTRQVLVQRHPEKWKSMDAKEADAEIDTNPGGFDGTSIHVMTGYAYLAGLDNISGETGDNVYIAPVEEDNEVTSITLEQDMAWAVRQSSDQLLNELNTWLSEFLQTSRYKNIYAKYYIKGKPSTYVNDDYYAISTGKISPFDEDIRLYSKLLGWDWRLLTSLIYQESKFNINVKSWAGAFGIMQLMPGTATRYGILPDSPPGDQIRAGAEFLKWLDDHYRDIQNPAERIKFVLAAYNVGPGHIDDARNLARKNLSNPDVWEDNVDIYLLSKSLPEFYNDPVVKHGYCKGEETYAYVTEVLERYEHYKNIVPELN